MRAEFNRSLMSRRKLLASVIALNATLALAACGSTPITASQLQQDLTNLEGTMVNLWNALTAAGAKLPADALAKAEELIGKVKDNAQAVLDAIAAGTSISSLGSFLTAMMSAVQALAPIISSFYPPATLIGVAIQAAITVAQLILQEAGVTTTAMRAISPADADAARRTLHNAATTGLSG